MILYSLRTADPGFTLAKFDDSFNVVAIYEIQPKGHHGYSCSCPAGSARVIVKPCKHIKALRVMEPKANTNEFYCFEDASWHQPLAENELDLSPPNPTASEIDRRMAAPETPAAKSLAKADAALIEPLLPTFRRRI